MVTFNKSTDVCHGCDGTLRNWGPTCSRNGSLLVPWLSTLRCKQDPVPNNTAAPRAAFTSPRCMTRAFTMAVARWWVGMPNTDASKGSRRTLSGADLLCNHSCTVLAVGRLDGTGTMHASPMVTSSFIGRMVVCSMSMTRTTCSRISRPMSSTTCMLGATFCTREWIWAQGQGGWGGGELGWVG